MTPKPFLIALVIVGVAAASALAQNRGATGGTGQTGASSLGGGGFGGQSGFGAGATGGFGGGGFGGQFGGAAGASQGSASGRSGQLTSPTLRTNQSGFVGRDATDVQAFFEALGRASQQGGEYSPRSRSDRSDVNDASQTPPAVRVKLRVAFDPVAREGAYTTLPTPDPAGEIVRLLARSEKLAGVGVAMEGRAVTLQGEVASDSDRRVAVQLASMTPGVDAVRDKLTVADIAEPLPAP